MENPRENIKNFFFNVVNHIKLLICIKLKKILKTFCRFTTMIEILEASLIANIRCDRNFRDFICLQQTKTFKLEDYMVLPSISAKCFREFSQE